MTYILGDDDQPTDYDLWIGIWGSGFETYDHWLRLYGSPGWDEDPSATVTVACEDPHDDAALTISLTLADIHAAIGELAARGITCWGTPITPDFTDWDADAADLVLQMAVYGEIVYG